MFKVFTSFNFFRLGATVAPYIPVLPGNAVCDLGGLAAYWLLPQKRRVVLCNLGHALPDRTLKQRRKIARDIFRHNLRNYFDLFRVHKLPVEKRRKMVEFRNLDLVFDSFKQGKGVLAICAHQGSFSLISQVATPAGFDFYLAVEPIDPPELFELVSKLRSSDPRTFIFPVGGPEVRKIFRALKGSNMVCLAIDRDVTGTGKSLPFFGTTTILPTGPAEVALRTGAVVLSATLHRTLQGKHILEFFPGFVAEPTGDKEADLKRVSLRMLGEIEKRIRERPNEWILMQPVWPDCEQPK